MKVVFGILIFSLYAKTILFAQATSTQCEWINQSELKFNLNICKDDSNSSDAYFLMLNKGIGEVEKYFGNSFLQKFDVFVYPNRNKLNEQWSKDWGIPDFKSECWMVASGVAKKLDLLSPRTWKEEACEHNPDDQSQVQKIITHELVHVFHGQRNPIPDFSGMGDLGWFIEGLAVFVSCQLDGTKENDLLTAKQENKLPIKLNNAWSGKYRYTVCGAIVRYIEKKWGHQIIIELLKCTKQDECLNLLQVNEVKLLEDWKESIR